MEHSTYPVTFTHRSKRQSSRFFAKRESRQTKLRSEVSSSDAARPRHSRLAASGSESSLLFISCVPSGFVMVRCVALSVLGVKERRNSVIAGKFVADFTEELHAMMKEYSAHDNLPAKQSRWEISLHNARDLSWMRQPAS